MSIAVLLPHPDKQQHFPETYVTLTPGPDAGNTLLQCVRSALSLKADPKVFLKRKLPGGADGAPRYVYAHCAWDAAANHILEFNADLLDDNVSVDEGGCPALWLQLELNNSSSMTVGSCCSTVGNASDAVGAAAAAPPQAAAAAASKASSTTPKQQSYLLTIHENVVRFVPCVPDASKQRLLFMTAADKVKSTGEFASQPTSIGLPPLLSWSPQQPVTACHSPS